MQMRYHVKRNTLGSESSFLAHSQNCLKFRLCKKGGYSVHPLFVEQRNQVVAPEKVLCEKATVIRLSKKLSGNPVRRQLSSGQR